jgi:hypothetical protein
MTDPARAFPDPPRAALFAAAGGALLLALAWLAGIGRSSPPPDPLRELLPRLAALEARPLPEVAPALARAEAALQAAAEARRAAEAGLAEVRRSGAEQAAALDRRLVALEATREAEERRLAALEEAARRPVVEPAALAALAARVDRLAEGAAAREAREMEQERAREVLTRALEARIAAAEGSMGNRVAALEAATAQRLAAAETALNARAAALERGLSERLAAVEARERRVTEAEARLARLVALGAARLALEEGRPLGAALSGLPDPPPALQRFAEAAPPTEAALRLSFAEAARAARAAAEPERGAGLLDAAAQRLGGLVTIRRGEELLLGNPAEATLDLARRALEAGDLAGAVARLARLPERSRAAMAPWLAEAEALLAARAALAQLAGG